MNIKWFPPSWIQISAQNKLIYIDPAYLKTYFNNYPKRIEFSSWPDPIDGLSQTELWPELTASDVQEAAEHLKSAGVVRRDEIEQLPAGFEGFWVQNPASIIHLVSKSNQ